MQNIKYTPAAAVRLCFRYAPGAALIKLIIEIINGALTPLTALAVASFINNAAAFVNRGGRPAALIAAVAIMALFYAYSQAAPIIVRVADKTLDVKLRETLRPQLIQKHARISFALLENPETLDLAARVCDKTEAQMAAILNSGIGIIRLSIQVFGTLSILALHIWWMVPLFLIGAVPIALIARKGGKTVYLKDAAITKLTRKYCYLSGILTGRETAAERALFGYADGINKKFSAAHLKRSDMNTKNIAVEHIAIHSCGLIVNALVIAAVFMLLRPVGAHAMSHGLYVALAGALIGLARVITGAVAALMWEAAEYSEYMRDYSRFFALPEDNDGDGIIDGGENASFTALEIRGLRFRYTPESPYVLDGVNLSVEKGKSYSLIGKNGAGKSTLVKILLGLYRDFEGEIYIDGADISEYGAGRLRRLFSVVYQDYAKYYIPFGDNITLGNECGDFDSALAAAELCEVCEKLPDKQNTPLGKIYGGGTDISGGEWQKVAVARALYKNTPFIILDEPAASLSPAAESGLYRRFAEITKDKTSLLISHRLGSTKLSDVLFVLDNGVIAETGTHEELIGLSGIYADMFKKQKGWYDDEN